MLRGDFVYNESRFPAAFLSFHLCLKATVHPIFGKKQPVKYTVNEKHRKLTYK